MDKTAAALIGVSILIGLTPFMIERTSVNVMDQEFESNVTVVAEDSDNNVSLGFRAEENLLFGQVPVNAEMVKEINLSTPGKTYVRARSSGNISEVLDYQRKMYFDGAETLTVRANATEPGYYEGKLDLKIMYPKNELGKRWLDIKSGYWLPF